MNYAIEMGSGAMIKIPGFIKICSAIKKLIGRDTKSYRQHGDCIGLLLFFQNKMSRLKIFNETTLCYK
jgi:hypothetical protein